MPGLTRIHSFFLHHIDKHQTNEESTPWYTAILPKKKYRTMHNSTDTHAVTQLLRSWHSGDKDALEKLSPLVYQELRHIARQYFYGEHEGHTLQPTALVNEALLRMMGADVSWQDRKHFYTVAGSTMRRILVDHARSRLRKKRGGGATVLSLDETKLSAPEEDFEILALDNALEALSKFDQRKYNIIELRYFAGLTAEQTAKMLSISEKTVQRDMRFAEAWLNHALSTSQYDA